MKRLRRKEERFIGRPPNSTLDAGIEAALDVVTCPDGTRALVVTAEAQLRLGQAIEREVVAEIERLVPGYTQRVYQLALLLSEGMDFDQAIGDRFTPGEIEDVMELEERFDAAQKA